MSVCVTVKDTKVRCIFESVMLYKNLFLLSKALCVAFGMKNTNLCSSNSNAVRMTVVSVYNYNNGSSNNKKKRKIKVTMPYFY